MENASTMARSHPLLDPGYEALHAVKACVWGVLYYRFFPVLFQLAGGRVVQLAVESPSFKSLLGGWLRSARIWHAARGCSLNRKIAAG
jgi:hypothetical protein